MEADASGTFLKLYKNMSIRLKSVNSIKITKLLLSTPLPARLYPVTIKLLSQVAPSRFTRIETTVFR